MDVSFVRRWLWVTISVATLGMMGVVLVIGEVAFPADSRAVDVFRFCLLLAALGTFLTFALWMTMVFTEAMVPVPQGDSQFQTTTAFYLTLRRLWHMASHMEKERFDYYWSLKNRLLDMQTRLNDGKAVSTRELEKLGADIAAFDKEAASNLIVP